MKYSGDYTVDPIYGCWIANGRKDKDGYPLFETKHGLRRAHGVLWREAYGEIPEGKELEHLCRRRDCVRPSHKQVVDRRENLKLRSWKYRTKVKACPNGHPKMRNCLRTIEGGLVCRSCNKGEW